MLWGTVWCFFILRRGFGDVLMLQVPGLNRPDGSIRPFDGVKEMSFIVEGKLVMEPIPMNPSGGTGHFQMLAWLLGSGKQEREEEEEKTVS